MRSHLFSPRKCWRQKEQFSDGVGYSWIDTLKAITSEAVSDEQMAHAAERFTINPASEQGRILLSQHIRGTFPKLNLQPSRFQAYRVWHVLLLRLWHGTHLKGMNDPSGRAVAGKYMRRRIEFKLLVFSY